MDSNLLPISIRAFVCSFQNFLSIWLHWVGAALHFRIYPLLPMFRTALDKRYGK